VPLLGNNRRRKRVIARNTPKNEQLLPENVQKLHHISASKEFSVFFFKQNNAISLQVLLCYKFSLLQLQFATKNGPKSH